MSNFYLKFSVDGVMLKRIYCPSIVDGTNRFIHAKFEFGDGWGELTKYLFVARNNETYSVLMESDECIIDQHVVNTVGQFDMQVVGVKDDVRAVTNAITIKVKTSEMANNPSGEETRFTSDFIITSLEEIRKLKLDTEDIAKEYSEQAGAYAELAGDHEETAKRIVDEMPGQINKAVEDATLAAERFAEESKNSKDHSKQYADESKEFADKAESSAVISKAIEDTVKQISDELPTLINEYVADHKEELKGDKGDTGEIPAEDLAQIQQNTQAISQQSDDIVALQRENAEQQRQINFLKDMTEGVAWRKEIDTEEAYTKAIPKGAKGVTVNSIGGKCIVENQLVNPEQYRKVNPPSSISVTYGENGKITINVTEIQANWFYNYISAFPLIANHKYLYFGDYNANASTKTHMMYLVDDGYHYAFRHPSNVFVASGNAVSLTIVVYKETNNITLSYQPQLIDLTQMFGAGNEPSLEQCQQIFTEYIPYTEPTLQTIACDEIIVKNASQEVTFNATIPSSIQQLEGYGWSAGTVFNEVDFENKVFIQRVGKHLPTSKDVIGVSESTYSYMYVNDAKLGTNNITTIVPSTCYQVKMNTNNQGMVFSTREITWTSKQAFIEWFNVNGGIYYELAEPIITDISDLLTDFDNSTECEGNGSITFHNPTDYKVPIPNTEEYIVKVSEAL